MRELEDVALAFDTACRAAGVNYAFVGGVAVLAWGQPRATMDADALVSFQAGDATAFVQALASQSLQASEDDLRDALKEGSHVTVFDTGSMFHVDLKLARTPEERREVTEAEDVEYGKGRLRVARPEDVIAYKLLFGSPQDLADARSILVRQEKRLRWAELDALSRRLGVRSLLVGVAREVGLATRLK